MAHDIGVPCQRRHPRFPIVMTILYYASATNILGEMNSPTVPRHICAFHPSSLSPRLDNKDALHIWKGGCQKRPKVAHVESAPMNVVGEYGGSGVDPAVSGFCLWCRYCFHDNLSQLISDQPRQQILTTCARVCLGSRGPPNKLHNKDQQPVPDDNMVYPRQNNHRRTKNERALITLFCFGGIRPHHDVEHQNSSSLPKIVHLSPVSVFCNPLLTMKVQRRARKKSKCERDVTLGSLISL